MAALIILIQALSLPFLTKKVEARTQVTVTIAAGGVACGVYFFFLFTVGGSSMLQNRDETSALLNHGQGGWDIRLPSVNVMQKEEPGTPPLQITPAMMQMDLLKFKF